VIDIDVSSLRRRIVEWLTPFFQEDEEGSPQDVACVRIVVRHMAGPLRGVPLETIAIPEQIDEGTVATLAKRIDTAVTGDAEALGSSQLYELVAFAAEGGTAVPFSRTTLRVTPDYEQAEVRRTDDVTLAQVLDRILGHNERLIQLMTVAGGTFYRAMQDRLKHHEDLAAKSDRVRLQYVSASEKMLSEESERSLRAAETEHEMRLKQEGLAHLGTVVQAILARTNGTPVATPRPAKAARKPGAGAEGAPPAAPAPSPPSGAPAGPGGPQRAPGDTAQPGPKPESGAGQPGGPTGESLSDVAEQLRTFVGTLRTDQLLSLQQVLDGEQQAALVSLLQGTETLGDPEMNSGETDDQDDETDSEEEAR
jgi:hypothetical protein